MISWNFPGYQSGQIKGVADAGIENFSGDAISSLTRENCQNSLDAAIDDENPSVVVEFERHLVSRDMIPGIEEYQKILASCKEFWAGAQSEKTDYFLDDAIKYSRKEKSFVLRISDYNTMGLLHPYSNDSFGFSFDGWNSLVKIDGGANKGADKAGAFGIGKSAPFANSAYRLVFYRTFNNDGERAAQGVARIISFKDTDGLTTTGIGYYGNPEGNDPVQSIPELDEINFRNQVGTDVFICGFKDAGEWKNEVLFAIMENFLMSIYLGKLSVVIKSDGVRETIDKSTLGDYISKAHNMNPSKTKGTYGNYLALTRTDDAVQTYTNDFHNMGTLELRILIDPNEKLDRKVLVVRKAGMKLFRLGNISRMVSFTGILELKGKPINEFFREMETVAHDDWEPGRHHDRKKAKEYYEEIKEWIRGIVSELAEHSSTDEMDVEGLSGILQKDTDLLGNGNSDEKIENLNDYLGEINIIQQTTVDKAKGFFYGQGSDGRNNIRKTTGTLGSEGDSGIRILKGKRKRTKKESHRGFADPNGRDIVYERLPGGETHCPLRNLRIIKQGTGNYSLNFEIPRNIEQGTVELVAVGENGKSNSIRIKDAKAVSGCASVSMNGGIIETAKMSAGTRIKINVTLYDSHDYAMEVNVYEHK